MDAPSHTNEVLLVFLSHSHCIPLLVAKYNKEKKKVKPAESTDASNTKRNKKPGPSLPGLMSHAVCLSLYDERRWNYSWKIVIGVAPPRTVPDEDSDDDRDDEMRELRTFTLKKLIRQLHIQAPAEHVMCLIGKKYPLDAEEFRRARLPGRFDN